MKQTESNPTSDKGQSQAPPYLQQFEEDTIDLYKVWISIWNKKWWVIVLTASALLGSVVYTQVSFPNHYKTKILLQAPRLEDIQSLNTQIEDLIGRDKLDIYGKYKLKKMIAEDVFVAFKNNLSSRNLQDKFIKEKGMIELLTPQRTPKTKDEVLYKSFAEMIKIEHGGKTSFSIELTDSRNIDKLINAYVDFIDVETGHILFEKTRNSIKEAIQEEIKNLNEQIVQIRNSANVKKQQKLNLISRYEEALQIATRLGIQDRDKENCSSKIFRDPNYCLGARTLSIEIEFLKKRMLTVGKNIIKTEIRKLEQKIALLQTMEIKEVGFSTVSIYKPAHQIKDIYRANRIRIIAIVTLVGLSSGIILVYFSAFLENRRKKYLAKSTILEE